MTILIASLFVAALIFSVYATAASLKASLGRIVDVIENERMPRLTSPNIRMGSIKHYKMLPIEQGDNVIAMPLQLNNSRNEDILAEAA